MGKHVENRSPMLMVCHPVDNSLFFTIFAAAMRGSEQTDNAPDVRRWYKRIPQLLLFVGLGVFFIWLSLRHLTAEDRKSITAVIGSVNTPKGWLMLGLAAFFALLADYFRAMRGKILLQPLYYEVRTSMMFYSVMVCFMANLALPRLGEVMRCTFLQRYEKVPFQKSLGTVITERAVDLVFWLVMFVLAILINTDLLNNLIVDADAGLTVRQWMEAKGLSLIGNHLLLILLGVSFLLALALWLTRKWWMKNRFFLKIWHFCQGLWQGFISIKDLKRPWRYWFWTVMMWVAYLHLFLCDALFGQRQSLRRLFRFDIRHDCLHGGAGRHRSLPPDCSRRADALRGGLCQRPRCRMGGLDLADRCGLGRRLRLLGAGVVCQQKRLFGDNRK